MDTTSTEISSREFVVKILTDYKTQLEFVNVIPFEPRGDYRPHLLREELLGLALWMTDKELENAKRDDFIVDSHLNYAMGMIQGILLSTNFVTMFKLLSE